MVRSDGFANWGSRFLSQNLALGSAKSPPPTPDYMVERMEAAYHEKVVWWFRQTKLVDSACGFDSIPTVVLRVTNADKLQQFRRSRPR
ncbi:hypothetical protein U1Q18_003674 [Sarracenia purpurea var. burkii]